MNIGNLKRGDIQLLTELAEVIIHRGEITKNTGYTGPTHVRVSPTGQTFYVKDSRP